MAEHTPTPWSATEQRDWLEHSCCHDAAITAFENGKRQTIAEAHSSEDAAFIVKAANNHDALVKALTDLLDDKQTTYAVRVLRARAALASVGGVDRG